jgi:hypothetical protein
MPGQNMVMDVSLLHGWPGFAEAAGQRLHVTIHTVRTSYYGQLLRRFVKFLI